MTCTRTLLTVLTALSLVACGDSHSNDDGGSDRDSGTAPRDAGFDAAEGFDAGGPDDDGGAELDGGEARDAGTRMTCDAMDARRDPCPEALCDGPDQWYWNGDACFNLDCGACTGADCDLGTVSQTECETAHASCVPTLCRASGGTWMWWAEECGHRVCGEAVPEICLVGSPVCDCGPMANWVDGVGCQNDVACTMGPMMTPEQLCTGSGGSWENICCPTECGQGCPLPCTAPACNCGPGKIFDDARGCIFATRCFERTNGQSCVQGRSRCEDGTICCDSCGGAGCAGDPRCIAPVCSDNPAIDTCGNNNLAP